jgi:hypothetical protein
LPKCTSCCFTFCCVGNIQIWKKTADYGEIRSFSESVPKEKFSEIATETRENDDQWKRSNLQSCRKFSSTSYRHKIRSKRITIRSLNGGLITAESRSSCRNPKDCDVIYDDFGEVKTLWTYERDRRITLKHVRNYKYQM